MLTMATRMPRCDSVHHDRHGGATSVGSENTYEPILLRRDI